MLMLRERMGTSSFFTAIDAVAPMLIGVIQPGFIFVICCRIFALADGACARLPAAHAGTGFRLGVAGVVFAGAGVGAIAVGYPFPVVIQRVQTLIRGVIAALALAGIVGAPALFRAGSGLGLMMLQVVVIRVDGQLLIGGVIAALAGIVGAPALFGAGGRFAIVGDQRMAAMRYPIVRGRIAAALAPAGFVHRPALLGAGGILGLAAHQVVVVRVYIAAFKGIRRMMSALGTGPVIYSHGYAGGFGLEMLCIDLLHE